MAVSATSHPQLAISLSPRYVNSLTVSTLSYNFYSCFTVSQIFPSRFLHVKFLENIGVTLFTLAHLPWIHLPYYTLFWVSLYSQAADLTLVNFAFDMPSFVMPHLTITLVFKDLLLDPCFQEPLSILKTYSWVPPLSLISIGRFSIIMANFYCMAVSIVHATVWLRLLSKLHGCLQCLFLIFINSVSAWFCDIVTTLGRRCVCYWLTHTLTARVELDDVGRRLVMKQQELLTLTETELPTLIRELGSMQTNTVLTGDYRLKIARQNYFSSNQDKVIFVFFQDKRPVAAIWLQTVSLTFLCVKKWAIFPAQNT